MEKYFDGFFFSCQSYTLHCLGLVWFEISCPASQDGYNLCEGGVRVCGDAVLLDFWCGFAVIFILSCVIAVLQNQAVCGN